MTGTRTRERERFALIIGAMKSGTTSLFEILSQHPEIASAREKEPDFFASDENMQRGWAWYTSLWDWDPAKHKVALEASVAYTKRPAQPGVPQRIASISNVDFRFIYLMRNPVDQVTSHMRHAIYAGWEQSWHAGIPEYMVDFVRYAMQLDAFTEHFSRDSLYITTLERFNQEPESVLSEVCSFLDVDPDVTFEGVRERYNSGDLYGVPRGVSRVVQAAPTKAAARFLMPRRLKHELRKRLARAARMDSASGRGELTEEQKDWLLAQIADDLDRLDTVYGVDCKAHWAIGIPRRQLEAARWP